MPNLIFTASATEAKKAILSIVPSAIYVFEASAEAISRVCKARDGILIGDIMDDELDFDATSLARDVLASVEASAVFLATLESVDGSTRRLLSTYRMTSSGGPDIIGQEMVAATGRLEQNLSVIFEAIIRHIDIAHTASVA